MAKDIGERVMKFPKHRKIELSPEKYNKRFWGKFVVWRFNVFKDNTIITQSLWDQYIKNFNVLNNLGRGECE